MNILSKNLKPLRDVRYFESLEPPQKYKSMPNYASKIYSMPKECVALGQRVGRKFKELSISIGHADHLYLCFTPSIEDGSITVTDYAVEPWHLFVLFGLSYKFNELTNAEKLSLVTDATFKTLISLAPLQSLAINELRHSIESEGEALRVCILSKEIKKYLIRVVQTVPVYPKQAEIFIEVTNLETKRSKQTKIMEVRFHDDAPSLVSRITISDEILTIHPRKSFRASVVIAPYTVPIQLNIADLS